MNSSVCGRRSASSPCISATATTTAETGATRKTVQVGSMGEGVGGMGEGVDGVGEGVIVGRCGWYGRGYGWHGRGCGFYRLVCVSWAGLWVS